MIKKYESECDILLILVFSLFYSWLSNSVVFENLHFIAVYIYNIENGVLYAFLSNIYTSFNNLIVFYFSTVESL